MRLDPYRQVFARPGVQSLMIVGVLARIPMTAAGVTLTLHVVFGLGHGFAAAGLVAAASTVGAAIGAPLLGRYVDRRGLRPVLVVTTLGSGAFWVTAPLMSYPVLLVSCLAAGVLSIPAFSVVRQSLAALVPADGRRAAYSLDSVTVELSFMIGPALAVLVATQVSTVVAIAAVGVTVVLSGVALFVLNPATRSDAEQAEAATPPRRRTWLRPQLITVLVASAGATLVLGGTDVAVVALLKDAGQVQWSGLVLAAWAVFSMAGGLVHGALPRSLPPLALLALLGLATIPVGLAGNWWVLCLLLLPAGALCAPTLAATADAVSQMAPAAARGEAMGLHGSAITIGISLGAPLVGAVVDLSGPAWGFAAAGAAGFLIATPAMVAWARRRLAAPALREPAPVEPAAATAD